jgi:glycosyltransferase involved in cell wall biosynthesis
MRTIAVSGAFVRPGRVGGAEQALYGYIDGLVAAAGDTARVRLIAQQPLALPGRGAVAEFIHHGGRFRNRFLWDTFDLPHVVERSDALLFPNYFTPPTLRHNRKITVINDLQYLHFPRNFSARKRCWLRASHESTLRTADVVVAISEFVRDDILERFGKRFEDRVVVNPTPIIWSQFSPDAETPPAIAEFLRDRPYVLSVAAEWPHKNIATLLRAFQRVRRVRPDLILVLVGQRSSQLPGMLHRGSSIADQISMLGLVDSVVQAGYVSDGDLAWMYRHARFFVFPSIFEGHGRPATEAIGLRLPVLTTNKTALPEATGGLAVYLDDPFDHEAMAAHILDIVDAPDKFAASESAAAQLRLKFSPEAAGKKLLELLL